MAENTRNVALQKSRATKSIDRLPLTIGTIPAGASWLGVTQEIAKIQISIRRIERNR